MLGRSWKYKVAVRLIDGGGSGSCSCGEDGPSAHEAEGASNFSVQRPPKEYVEELVDVSHCEETQKIKLATNQTWPF